MRQALASAQSEQAEQPERLHGVSAAGENARSRTRPLEPVSNFA